MARYEYRIADGDDYQRFVSLRDAEDAAEKLDDAGVQARIEYRRVDQPRAGEWAPLAWDDTLPGRLGYQPFPGYGIKVGEPDE